MPGTNRLMSDEASVNIGALQQRVYGLEQAIGGISQQIGALAQKIDQRAQTNWPLFYGFGGLFLSIVIAVGALAYWPIRETQADLKAIASKQADMIGGLGDKFVTIRELDGRSARTLSEVARVNQDINAIEKITVPRGEHEEKWRSSEKQFENQQRQIDDLKRFNTDLVSARDFLKNLDERMRSLERRPQS